MENGNKAKESQVYECRKSFYVNNVDENGFPSDGGETIKKGSMWKIDAQNLTLTGADIHLDELTGLNWIEISKERLNEHFRMI